jgi:hypothetical protein
LEDNYFNDYYWKCAELAVALGFTAGCVRWFYYEIHKCFTEGKSAEECVQEIF